MNNRGIVRPLAGILASCCGLAAHAQSVPGIPYQEFWLDNGLHVIVHEDRKAPIVNVTVWYHVGSKNETRGRTGFAHLFEHLMFNGSENYDGEYFAPFQEVGATDMNGTTSADRTNYFQTVPTTALDLALWMESDRMGHLLGAIDQAKLDEQRGVVQNEKRQGENEPYGTVYEKLLENVFPPEHPYSWPVIGSMEDLDAATLDDVYEWFRTYYGPGNATLVLAGDIDVEMARERVEHFFGDIAPGPPLEKRAAWELAALDAKRVLIEDRVPQARIYKAWRGPSWAADESLTTQVALQVLAGGKNSRLYERLVYREQLASDVGGYSSDGEIGGMIVLYASALPGVGLEQLERAIDEEVARLNAEGPTRSEIERVRTEIKAIFIEGLEEVGGFGGKAQILAQNSVLGGRPDFHLHAFAVLDAATPALVRDTTLRFLSGNAVSLEVRPYDDGMSAATSRADRSAPPLPTSFPAADFPDLERATLANGLKLIVVPRPAVPIVHFSLELDAGFAADQFGKPGLASLALDMLDEGTESRDALEISDALSRLGAYLATSSNLDRSAVSLSALTGNLDPSLALYADVILRPAFPETELARLKPLRLAEIREEKTTPLSLAYRLLPRLIYGEGHAYGLGLTGTGTEESVAGMSRADLLQFHATWFRPGNATLIVTGDTTLAGIKPRLETLFAGWEDGPVPDKTLDTVEPPAAARVFLVDNPDSEQAMIIAGGLIGPLDEDTEPAIIAMNDSLGGSFTSRINMNLREDKAWSYGARTQVVASAAQRLLLVRAPVQTDRTADSMREIVRELSDYSGPRPPTADELTTAQRRSTLSLPGRWETALQISGDISWIVRFGLDDDYWDEYPRRMDALDVAAVGAAARESLDTDRLTWVVVGDLDLIRAPVEALGLGPITVLDADGRAINGR